MPGLAMSGIKMPVDCYHNRLTAGIRLLLEA